MNQNIKKRLLGIFEEYGIFINEKELDTDLSIDSFTFVTILIAIEESFMIALFDTNYDFSILRTFVDYYEMVEKYL